MVTRHLLAFLLVLPVSVLAKDYFTAAVFEHRPRALDKEYKEEIIENLKYYEKGVEVAAEKGADIILFNEYGILRNKRDRKIMRDFMEQIPDPQKVIFNPCVDKKEDQLILQTLSCIARKHNIYVVANLGEKQPCEDSCEANNIENCHEKCPKDGIFLYNAHVAFDRKGNLVARYHKMHTYLEVLNLPEEPEYVTFKTDFGTVGLITCFDSVFAESMMLARHYDVDTVLFSSYWYDDILPLKSIEWQQSWAIANKVNFMAANTHTPGNGSLGSGIFSKELGALVYTYEPDGESKVSVANVPLRKSNVQINPSVTIVKLDSVHAKTETGDAFPEQGYSLFEGPTKDHYVDYRYFKHLTENYTIVRLERESGELETCNNGFCCNLQYVANDMKEDYYFGAFSGLDNILGYFHWCEETCILLRCDPFDSKACVMQPTRSNTIFKSLKISGKFTSERVYPTVSKTKHRLAARNEWKYKRNGQKHTLSFEKKTNEPLLKAALMGRCYDRDPEYKPLYKF